MLDISQILRTLEEHCWTFDAVYEDYLEELVGYDGLYILRKNELIESCAVINGRRLYALSGKQGRCGKQL